MTLTTDSKQT